MNIDEQKIDQLLSMGIEEIIDREHLEKRLLAGERLRIKHGIDPTGDKLHLGHSIILWKLKEFQDLGHKIILILGDYTAQTGDPSDKLAKRPFLSAKEVEKNLKTYKKQISKILDIKKVEWHKNSQWLAKLTPRQLDELAELFSVGQMIARRNFKERWERGEEISLRELHYPLYQGYDSVMIKADLEIGGNDQLFNLLAGRKIQEAYNQRPQDIMTLKMIEGLDGEKMSKTQGNVINITDSPDEIYGKIMSMHDDLIIKYFISCTKIPLEEIEKMEEAMKKGSNPRDFKARLAFEIVKIYHGQKLAQKAEQEFNRIFREKKIPTKISNFQFPISKYKIIDLLVETKLATSKSQARQLIEQKAVKIDGKIIDDWQKDIEIKKGMIIQVGPRRFIRIDI